METHFNKETLNKSDFNEYSLDEYVQWENKVERNSYKIDLLNIKLTPIIGYNGDIKKYLDKTELIIKIENQEYRTMLNSQIIQQLGGRIWNKFILENSKPAEGVVALYSSRLSNNVVELSLTELYAFLKKELEKDMQKKDRCFFSNLSIYIGHIVDKFNLSIRYFPSNYEDRPNEIYGIVSSSYKALDQRIFRNFFLRECQEIGLNLDLSSSKQYIHKKFNSVYEFIKTKHIFINEKIDMSLVIEYGKNNGYRSYRFHWLFSIKESKDDIYIIRSQYSWRNNPLRIEQGENYQKFISDIIEEGKTMLDEIILRIDKLENGSVYFDDIRVRELLNHIKVAKATRERIYDLWKKNNDNSDLWSFVQCLIAFSNNSQSFISWNMQNLIKKSAIDILDNGLDAIKLWGIQGSRYTAKY